MSFINERFMLGNKTAVILYEDYAKDLPIIDYHCHLNPQMIAENYKFENIGDLMLGGDHYKWRVMRSNGIDECYMTGDKPYSEKFRAFAESLVYTIGNPMFHWTHLELKRYFGIDEILNGETAEDIWNRANKLLETEKFRAKGLIEQSNVEVICTTDDPMDDLKWHKKLKADGFKTKVLPTFRPDKAVNIGAETFKEYMNKMSVSSYAGLLEKLSERIEYFAENGCRLSDHALEYVPFAVGNPEAVFDKRMKGGELTKGEEDIFKTAVLVHCAKEYTKHEWAMQLHIGALRNNNSKMFEKLGPDTGFDSINDLAVAEPLAKFMDYLDSADSLPKTILYTLNPKDNYVLATMLGNFQKGPVPGKIQFGSGWWFNDQRDGMIAQMTALANLGLLGRFVGMLTDSRSFISYTRHEYFRRILCNMIGEWVEKGEFPNDDKALKTIIQGICYYNAKNYFNF